MYRELAALSARVARLEAEVAETRRVNAAWRSLHLRSGYVLGSISKRFDEVLRAHGIEDTAEALQGSAFDAPRAPDEPHN